MTPFPPGTITNLTVFGGVSGLYSRGMQTPFVGGLGSVVAGAFSSAVIYLADILSDSLFKMKANGNNHGIKLSYEDSLRSGITHIAAINFNPGASATPNASFESEYLLDPIFDAGISAIDTLRSYLEES